MSTTADQPTYTATEAYAEHQGRLAEMVETWVLDDALTKLIAAEQIALSLACSARTERQRELAERVRYIIRGTLETFTGEQLRDTGVVFSDFALAFDLRATPPEGEQS